MKRALHLVLLFLFTLILIIVINQSLALGRNVALLSPAAGKITAGISLIFFLGLLLSPVWLFFRFRKLEALPEDSDDPRYEPYLDERLRHLRKNKYLKEQGWSFDEKDAPEMQILKAYGKLEERGRKIIREEASHLFVLTAVSRFGSLDGLFVLITLLRLVWRLSSHYQLRASFSNILKLYGEMLTYVLFAKGIEDSKIIEEQVEAIVTSMFGAGALSAIPGAGSLSTVVLSSIVNGSFNALLCLRVGCAAEKYILSLSREQRREWLRDNKTDCSKELLIIVKDHASEILKSIFRGVKQTGRSLGSLITDSGRKVKDSLWDFFSGGPQASEKG